MEAEQVTVTVKKVVHNALRDLAKAVWDQHGICVRSVQFTWGEFPSLHPAYQEPGWIITNVEVETLFVGPHIEAMRGPAMKAKKQTLRFLPTSDIPNEDGFRFVGIDKDSEKHCCDVRRHDNGAYYMHSNTLKFEDMIGWMLIDVYNRQTVFGVGLNSLLSATGGNMQDVEQVLNEVKRATVKFPTWPTDPLHALAVLGEEYGELNKAMLQLVYEPHMTSADEVRKEAIQTAAMALRLVMSLDRYEYRRCEQHEQ